MSPKYRQYSQDRQQEWLEEVFGDFIGCGVDVGANDGVFFSNTLRLEQRGWKILCIEANPAYSVALECRELVEICAAGATPATAPFMVHTASPESESSLILPGGQGVHAIEVEIKTVDSLLDQHGFQSLDLVSIDVEGTEADVIRGCNIPRWKPKAIIVEWLKDKQLWSLMESLGYAFAERIAHDDCYLRID